MNCFWGAFLGTIAGLIAISVASLGFALAMGWLWRVESIKEPEPRW